MKFMNIAKGTTVRVKEGASRWMKQRGYWIADWPSSIDGMTMTALHDYTDLPNDACHWWCECETVKDCGVHPQFLEAIPPRAPSAPAGRGEQSSDVSQ